MLLKLGRTTRAGWLFCARTLFCLFVFGFAAIGQGQTRAAVKKADRIPGLIVQLRSPGVDTRASAAAALGKAKDPRAVAPLIAALGDTDDGVKTSAARALGEIGDDRAVEPLIAAMKAVSLVNFPAVSQTYLEDSCQNSLRAIGPPAVAPLISLMNTDSSLTVRELAAKILGKIRDARAVDALFTAMKATDSEDMRSETSRALGEIGEPSVENLIGALNDQNTEVRWYAARALADQYDARVTAADATQDAARGERARAVGPDDHGEEALIAALRQNNLAVVAGGYRFFYEWGGEGSEKGLIAAMDQFGKKEMMQFFLNHGDVDLRTAAQNWAKEHGYIVEPLFQTR